jgi:predicted GNAT family acetyltransferase
MHIQHKQTGSKGAFIIEEEGDTVAELVYANSGENMIIEHTQVDDELRGRNIGYELVHHAVEYARSHQMKIVPVCQFAKAVFDKKPDFSDVLG